MEIPAPPLYRLFWTVIQYSFLMLAFHALDNSPDLGFSHFVLFWSKIILPFSASSTSFFSVIFPPLDSSPTRHLVPKFTSYGIALAGSWTKFDRWTSILPASWVIGFLLLGYFIHKDQTINLCCFYIVVLMTIGFLHFTNTEANTNSEKFSSTLSYFNVYCAIVCSNSKRSFDELIRRFVPRYDIFSIFTKEEVQKAIEFSIGLLGTILFQRFIKITSFDHVLVFLYLAVWWFARLALSGQSTDFGVSNFLLSNVIVGSTVSIFYLCRILL